jgi:hypothetical protein
MAWDHITSGVLYVKQQKTGKELWIPIHAELAATLARAPRQPLTILTSPRGGPAKDPTLRDWIKQFGEALWNWTLSRTACERTRSTRS